jgi:lipoprotein signal peptidase
MFKVKLNNALWLLSTVATVLLLDYGAKLLAKVLLKGQQPVSFLQDMLILVYAENMGAMLSAGHSLNEELRAFVFIGLVSAALSIWTIWLMTRESEIL